MTTIVNRAFTIAGLARSPWILAGVISGLVAYGGGAWFFGYKVASDACQTEKAASREAAALDTAAAAGEIADIRVESEQDRAEAREAFNELKEVFPDAQTLQQDLDSRGCELDPELLRQLNDAILRTRGTD